MHIKKIYNTVWTVEHASPTLRVESMGLPVPANEAVIIRHSATCNLLASDLVDYMNDFGLEYEV